MKTFQEWDEGPAIKITDYLQPGDEVDEEMFDHFSEVVSPQYFEGRLLQAGEAEFKLKGCFHFLTFGGFGDRYLYLGILPAFKQPKY